MHKAHHRVDQPAKSSEFCLKQLRIIKKDNKEDFDKDLTKVINGISPNFHSSLFTAFLRLFFSAEVKYALEKEPNFYILGTSVSWTGSAEESK